MLAIFGVVPVLVGPLQVLITILPGIALALGAGLIGFFRPTSLWNFLKLLWKQKLAVVILAVIVGGGFFGYRKLGLGASLSTGAQEKGQDWPTARFDVRRRGWVPGSKSPMTPQPVLMFKEGTEGFLSSPAVVGNRVYIASASLGAFAQSGQIFCLNADDLKLVWAKAPENYRPTFSSPVVAGDRLVCGEGLHTTRDARVICLDLREGKEGETLWTFATKNHVECTPIVSDGRVFVGAGDDGVYCLDLLAGADGQPKVHWHLPGEEYVDSETSLAVHEGIVYLGLGNGGQALCAIDAKTGKLLKKTETKYPIFSPPSIDKGKLYLGMGNGDYVAQGEGGAVVCFDLKTLKPDWTFDLPQTVLGAVAIDDDRLFFCCRDGSVYALSKSGKLIAKSETYAPLVTSPAVTDQAVYAVNDAGLLIAFDRQSLEPIWEYRLGTQPLYISSPVVARGKVYVGTQKDGMLAVGSPGVPTRVTPLWSYPLGGPGKGGCVDQSPLPAEPGVRWSFPPEADLTKEPAVKLPVIGWGKDVYAVIDQGKHRGIVAFPSNAQADSLKPTWHHATTDPISLPPVLWEDRIFFVVGDHLHGLDRRSGVPLWKVKVGESAQFLTTFESGEIIVGVGNRMVRVSLAGALQGDVTLAGQVGAPGSGSAMLIGSVDRNSLAAFDRATLRPLWNAKSSEQFIGVPLLARKRFVVGSDKGLQTRSLVDGSVISTYEHVGGAVSADIVEHQLTYLYVNSVGELIVQAKGNGDVKNRIPGARPGFAPLVSRGQVLVVTDKGLSQVQFDETPPRLEAWLEVEGIIAAPTIIDSHIFVPTSKRGLVCIGVAP